MTKVKVLLFQSEFDAEMVRVWKDYKNRMWYYKRLDTNQTLAAGESPRALTEDMARSCYTYIGEEK